MSGGSARTWSALIYRRQNEIPFPSHLLPAANDKQTTLLRTPRGCYEARNWLDQFCPLLTTLRHVHILPIQQLQLQLCPPPKGSRSKFSIQMKVQVQMLRSLPHPFVCLSFLLFLLLSFLWFIYSKVPR